MSKLAKLLRTLAAVVDLRDMVVFSGLAFVFYGLVQVYPPAAWVVVGAALFLLGVRK